MSYEAGDETMSYEAMIERMESAVRNDGEGFGNDSEGFAKLVTSQIKRELLARVNKNTQALLKPCLPHLARSVERVCTDGKHIIAAIRNQHFPDWESGNVFVVAANRTNALALRVDIRTEQELPDLSDIALERFWRYVSEAIDAAGSAEATAGDGRPRRLLTKAVLAKMGAVELRKLRQLTSLMIDQRAELEMAIICVAGSEGTQAAGCLMAAPLVNGYSMIVPLPAVFMLADEA